MRRQELLTKLEALSKAEPGVRVLAVAYDRRSADLLSAWLRACTSLDPGRGATFWWPCRSGKDSLVRVVAPGAHIHGWEFDYVITERSTLAVEVAWWDALRARIVLKSGKAPMDHVLLLEEAP